MSAYAFIYVGSILKQTLMDLLCDIMPTYNKTQMI